MTAPASRSPALPVLLVLAVALAAGLGLFAGRHWFDRSDAAPTLQGGLSYPEPRVLPPFALDLPDGQRLDADALRGHWTLVFVGFTHCPDVCPTTLAQLAAAERLWADLAPPARPRILFVSVDPARDSAETTARYARHFSPDALGATADDARLEPFTRSLGMVYMQTPVEGGSYTVDHSAGVAVLDPDVRLVAQLRPPFAPATIAADLRTLMQAHAP